MGSQVAAAWQDVTQSLRRYELWSMLAWSDIKLRYRRTMIGPFWLAISSIATIAVLGLVYSRLFKMELSEYLPYLASGMALWSLISTHLNEAADVFSKAAPLVRQVRLPYTFYVCRQVTNTTIVFLHVVTAYVLIACVFGVPVGPSTLTILPALACTWIFGCWVTLLIGTVALRYRDVGQVVSIGTHLAFFVTPIFFRSRMLASAKWVAQVNPLYHVIEICRAPMLGHPIPVESWIAVLGINLVGIVLAFAALARFRSRLPYWM